ncbi:MAG TPA: DNA ligase-associated DEXH box helicase, partial [Thermoanaerobaculia bacterium]|nr:DNA ligase-associated DEXH box helicase [Thermoanaerobaculia bacterium]
MIRLTEAGLFCEAGGFHIDPWRPVDRAVVTHAHGDHLTWGCRHHLVSEEGFRVSRARLGEAASIQAVPYGEAVQLNDVRVSLHPAG